MMKSLRILLASFVMAIGLTCFSQTAFAESETTLTSLMEVLKEDQKEASYNINLNAPFPQVFNTIEEAAEFFRNYHNIEEHEEKALDAFVRESLRDEGRIYVFDNFRRAGFFVVDCRNL